MAEKILMPKMGMTMTEGTVEEWKVKEGDTVKTGDILFTASTDKITNDVESQHDGTILKIIVPEGTTVDVYSVVAYIGAAGESILDEENASPTPAENEPSAEPSAASGPSAGSSPASDQVKASPAAKKLAREKGIDLSLVTGTGPNGKIKIEDVEQYLEADVEAAAHSVPPEEDDNNLPPKKVDPLRRSIAKNMTESWHISPRVTYTRPVDMTEAKEMRRRLKDAMGNQGLKITYNHILMKVCARVLMEIPDVNGSFSDNMLTHHRHANVGLAVAKGDGLIVPNVKRCEEKSLTEISREMDALIRKTRNGDVALEDITGGTFTISSLGPYGITSFSPIINQPELAILGVCDIVDTPVVRNGEIVIRPIMNLSLTADHRVIDGVKASRFLQRVAEILENPYLLMS
ncbi:dihydrolipoamide acetyltransferase family protein [Eubacterium pyruvativorans]|uniref:dihydrolipoamide acetyltransferase family protein n=1 Tax=Eubacterium pyruvativorans TaxID=155865 RepID=UPI0013D36CA1|nr:dihydrolipoamide acetyltransferase family protein [Eubacterium pyruvativorans]